MKNKSFKFLESSDSDKILAKRILLFFAGVIALFFWYLSIPLLLVWYVWKKTDLEKNKKYIASVLSLALLVFLFSWHSYQNRTPVVSITYPEDNLSIQAKEARIKGSVDPKTSEIEINNKPIVVNKEGLFVGRVVLDDEVNNFIIKAKNNDKVSQKTVVINRIFTDEERAEYEAKKQAQVEANRKRILAEVEANRKIILEEQKIQQEEQRNNMISSQFSLLDGSHKKLTRLIKNAMNDPDSYEHIETKYYDAGDYLVVVTSFRGTNAFGAVVKNTVKAKVSIDGSDIEILEQY